MKTQFVVGKNEQHKISIEQLLTGTVIVKVDGKQMAKGALKKNKTLQVTVEGQEKHCIKVEKRRGGFASWDIRVDDRTLPTDHFVEAEGRVATDRMWILLVLIGSAIVGGTLFATSNGYLNSEEKIFFIGLIVQFVIFLILFFATRSKNKIIVSSCFGIAATLLVGGIILQIAQGHFGLSGIFSIICLNAIWRGAIAGWRINHMIKTGYIPGETCPGYIPEGACPEFVRFVQPKE